MSAFAEYLNNALAEAKDAKAEAKDAKAEAEAAKAGERKLVSDVIALRFDRTIADRIRPILEAMDDSEGIYDVRSRALESASAEEFLSQLGLLNGHGPAAKN